MRKFWQKKYISKYTGKEIDDAVAKAGSALQNPMTAVGDLIVGGEDGAAEKLVKGADGKVLKMVSGAPAWADDAGGMENPMTTAGDLIVGGESGAAGRLAKGTDGQVLSMVSGAPAWSAAPSGGAEHLYQHNISYIRNDTNSKVEISIFVISTEPTFVESIYDLEKKLYDTFGNNAFPITGAQFLNTGGGSDGFTVFSKMIVNRYGVEGSYTYSPTAYGNRLKSDFTSDEITNVPSMQSSANTTITTHQIF